MVPWTGRKTRYTFSGISFASSDVLRRIKGPLDKAGYLWDYGVQCVTTLFAGATTTPKMIIGNESTANAYGIAYDFGLLDVTSGSKSPRIDLHTDDSTWKSAAFTNPVLPRNTVIRVTMQAATGGGAAGVADTFVEIIWAD